MLSALKYLLVISCSLNLIFSLENSREKFGEDESTLKLKNRLEKLLEIGNRASVRSYFETPEASLFPTIDVKNSLPGKFINFSAYVQTIKNVWNESSILQNIKSNFIFANLTEFINGRELNGKTNLKRFLSSKGDYAYETILHNRVPMYLKSEIELPSILHCDIFRGKFHSAKFQYFLNFEKFNLIRNSDFDQLVCNLDGISEILLLNKTNYEKLSTNENVNDDFFKTIEFITTSLNQGECTYIPSNWFYSVKADSSLYLTFEWKHFEQAVDGDKCFSDEQSRSFKLSDYIFEFDVNEESLLHIQSKFGYMTYFSSYLNSSSIKSLNKNDFVNVFKRDETVLKIVRECESNECLSIANKIFKLLDFDNDFSFSFDDLILLDEDKAVEVNGKLGKVVTSLNSINRNQMEQLQNMIEQLKELGKTHNVTDKIVATLKEKLLEWFNKLPEGDKQKQNMDDLLKVVDLLIGGSSQAEDESNQERAKAKRDRKKQQESKSEASEKNVDEEHEENEESFESLFVNEDDVVEIDAEENDIKGTKKTEL